MAVSGKTDAPLEIPYFLGGDSPPDRGDVTEAMAKRLHELLEEIELSQLVVPGGTGDDGKLVIVKDGAAAYKAMSGDATISEEGVLTIGAKKILTAMLADLVVTTGKVDNEAITLGKLVKALGLTEGYFADKAVGEAKLADGATTSRKAKLTAGLVRASGNVALIDGEMSDIPGAELKITPAVASNLLVVATFARVNLGNSRIIGGVSLDGKEQAGRAEIPWSSAEEAERKATAAQAYFLPLTAAAHTIKMQAMKSGGFKGEAGGSNTTFLYVLLAS